MDLGHNRNRGTRLVDLSRRAGIGWPELFACDSATTALAFIARWLGPPVLDLRLIEDLRPHGSIAEWRVSHDCQVSSRFRRTVAGQPTWTLMIAAAFEPREQISFDQAAEALAAWRQQRAERDREFLRLAAHTQELNLIQVLGQRCAAARNPADLFAAGVEILERSELAETIVVAHAFKGMPVVEFHGALPVEPSLRNEWIRRVRGILGWSPDRDVAVQHGSLADTSVPRDNPHPLQAVDEESLVILPLLRSDRVVACLILVPTREAVDREMRLAYSAGNQMALHLDRILTVQEAESDRTRTLLASLPQAVVVIDATERIVMANPAGQTLLQRFGLDPSGSARPLITTLGIEEAIERVAGGEASVIEDEVYGEPDRAFAVTISAVASPTGRQVALVLADVSERRRSQQRLAHAEKMTSLGQMISGVAHELNNPLSSVLGYAQLLARADVNETARRRLDSLEREAQRCQRIVQNLLSFARRRGVERQLISLNEVVESVMGLLGYQLRVSGVTVEQQLDVSLSALMADRHELQQLLVNLITNARHALHGQKGESRIRIRTSMTPEHELLLEIEDNGPGVLEPLRRKIFEPFFTTKEDGEGTGLGLSLSYDIVRTHGGRIEVLAGEDNGALFRMTFPAASNRVRDEVATPAEPLSGAAPSARAATILVVDDERDVAAMIRDALHEIGHTIHHAHDAESALRLLARESFDLLITDLRMPGIDGAQLIDEIRRQSKTKSMPVLLTTGDTLGDEAERLSEELGVSWIQKPFDLEALRRAVAERLVGG